MKGGEGIKARHKAVSKMLKEGKTIEEIADYFCVTQERVKEIIREFERRKAKNER